MVWTSSPSDSSPHGPDATTEALFSFANVAEQAACGLLSEIQNFLEARFSAVVGVWDFVDSRVGRKFQEQADPLSILCGCASPQVRQVGTIHRQDEIESLAKSSLAI